MSYRTLESFANNPFPVQGIIHRQYVTKEKEHVAVETSSGDMYVMKKIPKSQNVIHDSLSYTKLFHNSAKEIGFLSVPASNMLLLISSKLPINIPMVCVTEDEFIEHFEYKTGSKRLYYQAINELVAKNVIAKRAHYTKCYWVNPNILFNGDRTKLTKAE